MQLFDGVHGGYAVSSTQIKDKLRLELAACKDTSLEDADL